VPAARLPCFCRALDRGHDPAGQLLEDDRALDAVRPSLPQRLRPRRDRWYFKNGEPKHPASCRGLTLDASLDGKRATFETVSPKLYVEFLDDISNYLLPGAVPPPTR
jgi:hypothetical protein